MTMLKGLNLALAIIYLTIFSIDAIGFAIALWHGEKNSLAGILIVLIVCGLELSIWHFKTLKQLKQGQTPKPRGYYWGVAYLIYRVLTPRVYAIDVEVEAVLPNLVCFALTLYAIYQHRQVQEN